MTWWVARGDLACSGSFQGSISPQPLRPTFSMRLLSWSSSGMLRGWHGKGLIWQHTLAGCTGWKFATRHMSWPRVQTLTCSPRCPRCPAVLKTASAAQPTLAGSNSLGRNLEQPWSHSAPGCGSQRSLGLFLQAPGEDGSFVVGGIHQLYGSIRLGAAEPLWFAA